MSTKTYGIAGVIQWRVSCAQEKSVSHVFHVAIHLIRIQADERLVEEVIFVVLDSERVIG